VVTREVIIGEATYQQTLHFVSNYRRIRIYGLDITERKRAEGILLKVNEILEANVEARTAELTRMYEALRRSEQQLRSIIDHSIDGITLVDETGIILEWNHGQESITGLPRAEVLGCPLWDVLARITVPEHRSPERHEQIRARVLQAIDSGQMPGVHQPPERIIVRPDGTRRIVQPMPAPVKTDKGNMTVSITRDVTEPKLAEQALEKLNRALRMLGAPAASHRSTLRTNWPAG
jgi:PAS domain S-box-containing protein